MQSIELFQTKVRSWVSTCFGEDAAKDSEERKFRFLEEALELAQAFDCTRSQIIELVDYVYSRPKGQPGEEAGGTLLTLAALCNAADVDLATCGQSELDRVWKNIDHIRAKHARRRFNSPLP
jgi:NTP pyrophosphatase (non-canonical NTP hydrolase)